MHMWLSRNGIILYNHQNHLKLNTNRQYVWYELAKMGIYGYPRGSKLGRRWMVVHNFEPVYCPLNWHTASKNRRLLVSQKKRSLWVKSCVVPKTGKMSTLVCF